MPVFTASENYSDEYGFHKEVVSKIFDPATQAAYWSTPRGKRLSAPRPGPAPFFADDYAKRAEEPLVSMRAALLQEQAKNIVAGDLAQAKSQNVSMSFFGISLGEPLRLEPCQGSIWEQADKGTCRADNAIPLPLHQPWLRDDEFKSKLGLQNVTVRLGNARCPDWIECTVVLTVKGDVPLAAQLVTSDAFDNADEGARAKILTKLTQKYGKPGASDTTLDVQPHLRRPGGERDRQGAQLRLGAERLESRVRAVWRRGWLQARGHPHRDRGLQPNARRSKKTARSRAARDVSRARFAWGARPCCW